MAGDSTSLCFTVCLNSLQQMFPWTRALLLLWQSPPVPIPLFETLTLNQQPKTEALLAPTFELKLSRVLDNHNTTLCFNTSDQRVSRVLTPRFLFVSRWAVCCDWWITLTLHWFLKAPLPSSYGQLPFCFSLSLSTFFTPLSLSLAVGWFFLSVSLQFSLLLWLGGDAILFSSNLLFRIKGDNPLFFIPLSRVTMLDVFLLI